MKLILLFFYAISIISCTHTNKNNLKYNKPQITIALKVNAENQNSLKSEREQIQNILSELLECPIKIIIPKNNQQILNGFKDGTIDLGYLGAIDMFNAENFGLANILLARKGTEENFFYSYLVVKKESPYYQIQDLKDKKIAFSSKISASGYLIPYLNFINMGILNERENPEVYFGKDNVWFGDSYLSAVRRVLEGKVEVAAISERLLHDQDQELKANEKNQLRVLTKLKSIPSHVIAIRSSLDQTQAALLKQALLQLNLYSNLEEKIFDSKLVEVDPKKHLEIIREAFRKTGLTIETR